MEVGCEDSNENDQGRHNGEEDGYASADGDDEDNGDENGLTGTRNLN